MERDSIFNKNLALANILDVVPFIDNTEDNAYGPLNNALVRLYERNVSALQGEAAINRASPDVAVSNEVNVDILNVE